MRDLLQQTICDLVTKHGSYRNAAKIVGTDHAYLHKLAHGDKEPSDALLTKLGLVRVITYKNGSRDA